MDYTSIHIYGHLLSDDILASIAKDNNFVGNRDQDFGVDSRITSVIDYVWSSLRNDWRFFKERSLTNDPYGTRRSRDLMERLFSNLGYEYTLQRSYISINDRTYDITYICESLGNLPIIVVGDKTGNAEIDTLDRCSLDFRAKGDRQKKSPHATMLEYLNNTENIYGIVSNGQTIRLIRNSGQLVKLTYIEFDIRRMLEEDKYTEFCLLFRILHSSRFKITGDNACIFENWFNMSIASGNRIRDGLSDAVKKTMEIIGQAAIRGDGEGNKSLRRALSNNDYSVQSFNKELIHFIYRLLFLFIIEERKLVYQLPNVSDSEYERLCQLQDIYKKYYAASRFRGLSELKYLQNSRHHDFWESLMDTFKLFESSGFGEKLGIKPLGGILFGDDTLHFLKNCVINNEQFLRAFQYLNEFTDRNNNRVKINYSSLDVEEFGSVYEGILEMKPDLNVSSWDFGYVSGLDRNSTSSYYTRPDLVQSLIRTTLEPVIKEKIDKYQTKEEQIKALLSMKVCDAACGSGHIVLAMARTIAWYVCVLRTGEDNPASLDYRETLREVIQKCIYAVDLNPDAAELCKVVLWIEGYCAGTPLSFLDHHIRCGNSVVGVADLNVLLKGIPKEAFGSDSRDVASKIKEWNKNAVDEIKNMQETGQAQIGDLFLTNDSVSTRVDAEQINLAEKAKEISELPENTLSEERLKQERWEALMNSPQTECIRRACDIYTYAFYKNFKEEDLYVEDTGTSISMSVPYTKTMYRALEEIKNLEEPNVNFVPLTDDFKSEVQKVANDYRFFHWCVEFPEVFTNEGGFDVMCGNPPWDKLQMEDEKWFLGKDDSIVNAQNQDERKLLINNLKNTNPRLFAEYKQVCFNISSQSNFVRNSKRFPLTGVGKIDLYPLFAELCYILSKEQWGLIIPTGIATSDTNKYFFSKIIEENRLISIFDFENKERLFDIHPEYKISIFVVGKKLNTPRKVTAGFWLTRVDHLLDKERIYELNTNDFCLLNPNTKTCSVFRTSRDASLTARIYHNTTVMINESTKANPWDIQISSMFNMSTDSNLFSTYSQLTNRGAVLENNKFSCESHNFVPIYEGKMFDIYNHHFAKYPIDGERPSTISSVASEDLSNQCLNIQPWYWISENNVNNKLIKYNSRGEIIWEWKHKWFIAFRDVTTATTERTFIASIIPGNCGFGHTAPLIFSGLDVIANLILLGMLSSLVFDYVSKQKCVRLHMSVFIVKQLPVITLDQIPLPTRSEIIKRVVELCYFNHDLDDWAKEVWDNLDQNLKKYLSQLNECKPFPYDSNRRSILQAELDAIFAKLYKLSTDDLRYILDPEDVCGSGCINETFRVLKDNEIRQFGEYRTKRLVMEAWHKFGYDK